MVRGHKVGRDVDWAFEQYEAQRAVLPTATFPKHSVVIANLAEIADRIDVFLLDVFGVLSVGSGVIPGAVDAVAALQEMGKQVFVLTNSAAAPATEALVKYRNWGFDFTDFVVTSSRGTLAQTMTLADRRKWGVMAPSVPVEFPVDCVLLADDPATYDRVDGIVLLSSAQWTQGRQDMLIQSLQRRARPVLVGNPDIVAPRENGISIQCGWFAHDLAQRTGIAPEFFGKPFDNIYKSALAKVGSGVPKHRIAMVGDTLHTDILGGAHIGIKTVLITGQGVYGGQDVAPFIARSAIVPDWIAPSI